MVAAWDRAWDSFVPFLELDSAIRKVIYTTNAIDAVNFQLRKTTKNRCYFPSDEAAVKLLDLGIRNITGRHIDGDGLPLTRRTRNRHLRLEGSKERIRRRIGYRAPV